MRSGPWHQCGSNNQKMVGELLQQNVGSGVIISPRDVTLANATEYARLYHSFGAEVVCDLQFYNPSFSNSRLETYPVDPFRLSISQLGASTDVDIEELSNGILDVNAHLRTSAVIAPAVVYEAQQPDIVALNSRLFEAAKTAGEALGKPVYATVVLGSSATANLQLIQSILDAATKLHPDGWYFAYEFAAARLPVTKESVYRCGVSLMHLARTLKPVLHAFAGPLAIASPGFGATAAGLGHFQCLWQFDRERFDESAESGGGSAYTATRFFSRALWGTIVYPDELAQVQEPLKTELFTESPYTSGMSLEPPSPIDKWKAGKHLVYSVSKAVSDVCAEPTARKRAEAARSVLSDAVYKHRLIEEQGIELGDATNVYQGAWWAAISDMIEQKASDYDYLESFD